MANRTFSEHQLSIEKRVVKLFAHVTFGNTGAVTFDTANSKGVASVSRTSQGLFVVTLDNKYVKFLGLAAIFKVAAGSFPAAALVQVTAETVATAKTITVQFSDADTPAATDPANTEQVYIEITLGDSTAY